MGWFDEQIRQRIELDEERFSNSFSAMAGIVLGKRFVSANMQQDQRTQAAVEEILKYYHVQMSKLPDGITDINEQLEILLRPSGVMRRNVTLGERWYRNAVGAMLAQTVDGGVVALIPHGISGYRYFDYDTGKTVVLNARTDGNLTGDAICFYRPLPLKKLGMADLMGYILSTFSVADFVLVGVATLAVTLIAMLVPYINSVIFSRIVPSGQMRLLAPVMCLLIGVTVSTQMINTIKSLVMRRLTVKLDIAVQAAAMSRTLSLPASFFKRFSPGELNSRLSSVQSLCSMLVDALLNTGLTGVFSLVYLAQMFRYAPSLLIPSLLVILASVALSVITSFMQARLAQARMEGGAKESGLVFALINGVQKIKLAGAEKRAFSKWASAYARTARLQYSPPFIIGYNAVISTAIALVGTIAIYYLSVKTGVRAADYVAFNASYEMVAATIASLASVALTASDIKPTLKMVEPILQSVPEVAQTKQMVTRLSGALELNNVSFRYNEQMPMVLDDLSLKIKAGQYVAIVGRTGCGKSTLIRLLLGFEKPDKGAVYYDGRDLASLDLRSVRRNIGVVLQDGKLFPGNIYSNITISAPWLTLDDAWEAARMSGIDKDIEQMPMGMHTLIGGGSGGISGGQAQRLMIARAIAPKPRVLIFDEATSALDNITQKLVSDSLDALKCTRIVVAHRLSTIRHCNRIVVLEGGHIVQDGTYEELIAQDDGLFAELVRRQRLDDVTQSDGAAS